MTTAQAELTTAQAESITEQTELVEKLNCLEFETGQLNQAYQLWRSYVEKGTTPDWMAAAIRLSYDTLITFCLDTVSTFPTDVPREFSDPACEISDTLGEESTSTAQAELTTEQTELLEKLNCLQFETSQLNRAYQLWRSYVEQGTAADWMAAAIRITYDALITFCMEVSTVLAGGPHEFSARRLSQLEAAACEISGAVREESTTAHPKLRNNGAARGPHAEPSLESLPMMEPDWSEILAGISPASTGDAISEEPAIQQSQQEEERLRQLWARALVYDTTAGPPPELLPTTEPDWSGLEMPADISPASTGDAISEEPAIQQSQQEQERLRHLWARALVYDTTVEPPPELLPRTKPEPDWSEPEMSADISPASTGDAIWEQPAIQQIQQAEEMVRQLWGRALTCNTTVEPSPELLPMTTPRWSRPEMPVAISPLSTDDTFSEQPAFQDEEAGAEPATFRSLATLASWLQRSSTGVLFFIPPGAMGRIFRATSLGILILAGGTIVIYKVSAHSAAHRPAIRAVQNSAAQTAVGALAIPTGEKAEFKFDPDPVVAPLGRSFVLNAVLSRGSDVASLAVQIDYDANLLRFVGVSKGGFLAKDGKRVVLVQRDDPLTGILRISAEKPPGNPGISGDGSVFALSFQAKKRGKATVSIVPGAHDSQGRRIEMTGSQVSVRVN